MKTIKHQLLAPTSYAATSNSAAMRLDRIDKAAAQVKWDAAITGTVWLQYSCDTRDVEASDFTWTDVSSQATGGAAGNHMFDVQTAARWFRIRYVHTAGGPANFTIDVHGKGSV